MNAVTNDFAGPGGVLGVNLTDETRDGLRHAIATAFGGACYHSEYRRPSPDGHPRLRIHPSKKAFGVIVVASAAVLHTSADVAAIATNPRSIVPAWFRQDIVSNAGKRSLFVFLVSDVDANVVRMAISTLDPDAKVLHEEILERTPHEAAQRLREYWDWWNGRSGARRAPGFWNLDPTTYD